MSKRPTIADIARHAGVSTATVDRALTGRHKVREETLRHIADTARQLGYHGAGLLERKLREDLPVYRLGFLMLGGAHAAFFTKLGTRLVAEAEGQPEFQAVTRVEFGDWRDPAGVAAQLRAMGRQVQAIAAFSVDHPAVTSAVIDLKEAGVPVFSLLSDFAQGVRESYIGVNNRKAGRTIAWFIAKAARSPGKVAVLVGSSRFHGHEMREIGLRAFFRERAPKFEVIDTVLNPGSEQETYDVVRDLLLRHPDLVGLDVAGLGPEGVIPALRESGRAGELIAIANEDTPESRAALADEVLTLVIDTPLDLFCRETVALMIRALRDGTAPVPGQSFIPFEMITPESL